MQRLPRFAVITPDCVEGVVAALTAPGARLLAGGTDLLPHLKHHLDVPPVLISLARVRLEHVIDDGDALRIGAGVRLADLAAHALIRARAPSLASAAGQVASPIIRNLATLGGNLHAAPRCRYVDQTATWRATLGGCLRAGGDRCHVVAGGQRCVAALSSDCAPVLVSLGATARLIGPGGARTVALADYYRPDGNAHVARAPDELMTEVIVPTPARRRATYARWAPRAAIDFPLVSIALRFDLDGDTVDAPILGAAVVAGALASAPRRLAVDTLAGLPLAAPATAAALAALVFAQCRPLANVPYDPDYRRAVMPVHARRALAALIADGR
jgi:4-hydroxybenzoyl-CoA reductase subunit beta